jgi:hypothetical protein
MLSQVKVTAVATLAEKPVIRAMEGNRKMVGLSVYTMRRRHKTEAREIGLEREWHRVVITDQRLAAYAEAHLTEGDQVYLEGELLTSFCQSETFELRFISQICLRQEGDKLRRVTDEPDCNDPEIARRMLAVTRGAHLAVARRDDKLLECAA